MKEQYKSLENENLLKQEKQYIRNPSTGEVMELNTFSGKELFWRETDNTNNDPE